MSDSLQSNYREQQYDHFNRVLLAIAFFILLTLILISQLFRLQILSGQTLFHRSLDNQFTFASLQSQRGQILDRHGEVLAKNIPQFHLDLFVESRARARRALDDLRKRIEIDPKSLSMIERRLDKARAQDTLRIISRLSSDQLRHIYHENLHLSPLKVTPEFIRSYPCGEPCGNVTGYVLARKLDKDAKSDNPNILASYSGADGVEKSYDEVLSGKPGVVQLQRDAKGKILQTLSNIPAQNGADIILTIDARLQRIVADKMKGKRGAVVINNPSNGEIIALYSAPSYDPNAFLDPSLSSALKTYLTSPEKPLFNRALSGQFPPASTVKPFLALYALEEKLISPQFHIHDSGYFRYKDTANVYRNWNRAGHGRVDVQKAIILSNDTFFYHLALKLGIDTMSHVYDRYGFGSSTGIDLPGEKLGLLPTRSWKKARGQSWLIGDTIITGIGQGSLLVTPIQLAYANAIFAARGDAFIPHVVQSVKYPSHKTDTELINPTRTGSLSYRHWQYITKAMEKVIVYGTGNRFGRLNKPFAAKTGTAQLIKNSGRTHHIKKLSDHSWFMGFFVKEHPDFAITVLAENDNNAIFVAREIINAYQQLTSG